MVETVGIAILSAAGIPASIPFVGTLGIAGISASTIVGTAAILGAGLAYGAINQPKGPQPQDGQQTTRQPIPPRRRSYGLVKVAGPVIFSEVKNGTRFQIIAINHGEISSFDEHWLADNRLLLDGAGFSTLHYNLGDDKFVSITWLNGTESDAAFSALLTNFPEIWTAAHQGRGIAKVLVATRQPGSKEFTTVYPGAQPPAYRGVIRASKVWHPGDPAQHKDVPSTWTWTQNPVLIALDFHRHPDGMGLAPFDDVLFTPQAIAEDWLPAAGICDEAVLYKAGSYGPRYTCSGGYELPNNPPKDVLSAIMSTCDGQTYQRTDGAIGIRVGKTVAPTVTIGPDSILGLQGFRRGPSAALGSVNQITAKYTEQQLDFQLTDADPWRNEANISATGREETRNIDVSWVIAHNQVRRLMKLASARANPEWAGQVITNLDGMRAYNERYIRLVIPDFGIDGTFELTAPMQINVAAATCVLSVASLEQSAFDFDAELEEGNAPSVPDGSAGGDEIEEPAHLAANATAGQISMTWDAPTRGDEVAVAEYSIHGADNWFAASVAPGNDSAITPPLAPDDYDVRVRFVVGSRSSANVGVLNINVT